MHIAIRPIVLMRRLLPALLPALLACLLLAAAPVARAAFTTGLVDVDFNFSGSPTYSGAAVIGSAGDLWNGIDTTLTSATALNNTAGAASGATLTTPINGGYTTAGPGGTYNDLLRDGTFAQNSPRPLTLTLTGLAAGQSYELYFYSQDTISPGSATYAINSDTRTINYDATTNTLVSGTTFAHFASEAADGTGTLAITVTGSGAVVPGSVSGFQVRAIPPGTGSSVPLPAAVWPGLFTAAVLACFAVQRRLA